jgi:hypothetical protein
MSNLPEAIFVSLTFGLLVVTGFMNGAWQRKRALLEIGEDYRQLQVDHGVAVACADGLEQALENKDKEIKAGLRDRVRLAEQNAKFLKERDDARAQCDRIQQELHKADAETERLIDENAILRAQVAFLVQEKGHVDEAPQDTVATNATQDSKEVQTVRNARQRKGAARKEP